MDEQNDWKILAIENQLQYFETLGSRPYDEIEKNNLFLLKKKVGYATCGKPSELPSFLNYNTGYKEEELKQIKLICNTIIDKSDHNPIHFACTILILYHKENICETPVFRIANKSGNVFIDTNARVYKDWESFIKNNKLPECEYCFPLNGEYNEEQGLNVGFALSPACTALSKATDCLDTAGSIASVAAAGIFAASLAISVGPAVMTVAGVSATCSGAYSVTRNIGSLYDRKLHEQSIALNNSEARSAWMSLGASAAGTAMFAALNKAQKVVESGKSLSKLTLFGMHALSATSLVFSGFGFVDTFILCTDKYQKGTLTKKDIFDLSCEFLFLFNALASAHATTKLVNNMSTLAEVPNVQKKLTKTQKRNLRKKAAKKRAKGLMTSVTEEKSQGSLQLSTALQMIIFEAFKAYAPRIEEVLYTCQSIGHDIMSWKLKEISSITLMTNLTRSLNKLYNNYKDEIAEAIEKIIKCLRSLHFGKMQDKVVQWFDNCTEEIRLVFCTKLINMEDQIESLINETEREVAEMYEHLGIEIADDTFETIKDDVEDSDDIDFNPETHKLLDKCVDFIDKSSLSCQDLEEFSDIIDGVKFVIVGEFTSMVSEYKKSVEAAKAASGNSFDIKEYNNKLKISGDVCQHMFNKMLKSVNAENTIYKIKSKCKEISKLRNNRTTPVWEVCTNRKMFHFFGPRGSGDLPLPELLKIVSGVINNISLKQNENCTIMQEGDIVMIEVNDPSETKIVVYCGITEDNTTSGVILIVN